VFKIEQQKAKKVQRELEMHEMKQSSDASFGQNIILPEYEYNKDLNVYVEVNMPPKALYKSVGYNDLQRVQIIMEGDDKEKRSTDFKK